jgi:transposase
MSRILEDLSADWRHLDARIESLTREIEMIAGQDPHCERLMTVPGIGPIISSAMLGAIGTGDVFSKGCDFGAWPRLVPKQISNCILHMDPNDILRQRHDYIARHRQGSAKADRKTCLLLSLARDHHQWHLRVERQCDIAGRLGKHHRSKRDGAQKCRDRQDAQRSHREQLFQPLDNVL